MFNLSPFSSPFPSPYPYPLDDFHPIARNAAQEVIEHLKAPGGLIGMTFLNVMSVACQGLVDVKMPTGQIRPVSLDAMVIAESGERKSAVDDCIAKPIYDHDRSRLEQYEVDTTEYEQAFSLWDVVDRGLRKKITRLIQTGQPTDDSIVELKKHIRRRPVRPRLRQTVRRDIAARALSEALQGDGESIALMTDEGDILLRSDALKQMGLLNSAWDGSLLTLDRADGKRLYARHPRVTISIMVQPSVFRRYLAQHGEQARGTGQLARYLIGWPASTQGSRFTSSDPTWGHLLIFHNRVKALLDKYDRSLAEGKSDRTMLQFSDDAKAAWIRKVDSIEALMHPSGDYHAIGDFASRAGEQCARIAAILHAFSDQVGDITLSTFQPAANIVEWHVLEWQRLMSVSPESSLVYDDAHKLLRYLHASVWTYKTSVVTRNGVLRHGPLRTKRRLDPALDVLIESSIVWITQDDARRRYINLAENYFKSFATGAL
jgi:hypothetical protein